MEILKTDLQSPEEKEIKKAVKVLQDGQVIVYPTDTLYGLGANAFDEWAIKRIYKIKKRCLRKPLSVLVRDVEMARKIAYIDDKKAKILEAVWPGAITVILEKKDIVPSAVSGGKDTIAIRIPNCAVTTAIMAQVSFPVTTTSANISGDEDLLNVNDILKQFSQRSALPDLVLDAGELSPSKASTIIDLTKDKMRIVRIGPVSPQKLLELISLK